MENPFEYNFFRQELSQFAVLDESPDVLENGLGIENSFRFDCDRDHRVVKCTVSTLLKAQDRIVLKFNLEGYFRISSGSFESIKKDGGIELPVDILIQFTSLVYGSARGVLYAKSMGTPFEKVVLPPVYFNKVITAPARFEFGAE